MIARAAMRERIPMVILAGDVIGFAEPPRAKVGREWLRLLTDLGGPARLMESCVKWSFGLNNPGILPHTVQRACQLAMSAPRGPVFVSVPTEYMIAEMQAKAPPAVITALPAVGDSALQQRLLIVIESKTPFIITEV